MTASVETDADLISPLASRRLARLRRFDLVGLVVTAITLVAAVLWAFPLYWGCDHIQAGIRGGAAWRAAMAGALHP